MPEPLLDVRDLVVEHRIRGGGTIHAVSGVTFQVERGETLGLVGESGCGKSTTARAVTMLAPPTSGAIRFDGEDLTTLSARERRRRRRRLQMVFQDPTSSLNGRRRVRDIVAEGLEINRIPRPWDALVDHALTTVGLDPEQVGDRRPAELSGGQCQRVAIARALVLQPSLLVCDEPVSALDVSVQAQILNVLREAKAAYGLTILFIAHDLAVVKNVSDRVAVMYLGQLCEVGSSDDVLGHPLHPYTEALLRAVPEPDPHAVDEPMSLIGDIPSPMDPPSGCRFRTRCPFAVARCAGEVPELRPVADGHSVACHFPGVASSLAPPRQQVE